MHQTFSLSRVALQQISISYCTKLDNCTLEYMLNTVLHCIKCFLIWQSRPSVGHRIKHICITLYCMASKGFSEHDIQCFIASNIFYFKVTHFIDFFFPGKIFGGNLILHQMYLYHIVLHCIQLLALGAHQMQKLDILWESSSQLL